VITGEHLVHTIYTDELGEQDPAISMLGSDGAPICIFGNVVLNGDNRDTRDAARATLVAQLTSPTAQRT
jgi:hypothetical protein